MFDYSAAFSRNIGWLTEKEQLKLKGAKVAIAGLGGAGGEHLVTLSRLGISNFSISDFDDFEVHNFNRQAGAMMSTIGMAKCEAMLSQALDINPESTIATFPDGINEHNVDEFLEEVDVYVDSLDFFALEARILIFSKCTSKNIPIVTAAPLGMGTAILCFSPGKMTFEEYFRFNDKESREDKLVQFLIGLSPSMLQRDYLVVPAAADFKKQKGPSLGLSIKLGAGTASANVIKYILNRGDIICAPHGLHFDAYKNKLRRTWRPWGNRNVIQRVMFKIASNIVNK